MYKTIYETYMKLYMKPYSKRRMQKVRSIWFNYEKL